MEAIIRTTKEQQNVAAIAQDFVDAGYITSFIIEAVLFECEEEVFCPSAWVANQLSVELLYL